MAFGNASEGRGTPGRLRALVRRWGAERSGAVAVEFALIFPILVLLLFGIAEFSHHRWATSEVSDLANSMADVVTRARTLSSSDLRTLAKAADILIDNKYRTSGVRMDITALLTCYNRLNDPSSGLKYITLWSMHYDTLTGSLTSGRHTEGALFSLLHPVAGSTELPGGFSQTADESVIVVETETDFTPIIGHFLIGPVNLHAFSVFRPRHTPRVNLDGARHGGDDCTMYP